MATLSTGITTTSMFLTPQAVDDFFSLNEDSAAVTVFDVMWNDLGGAAKSLYSTTTGSETDLTSTEITDLTSKDLVGVYEATEQGARVAIRSDGKLSYDTTNIAAMLNALGAGEMLVDHVTYAIRLGNGTLSLATMTVTIYGTNDRPVIGAASDLLGEVIEPGLALDDVTPVGDLSDSGQLAASDVDNGAVLTWSAEDTDGTDDGVVHGAYGSLSVTEGGLWTYTLDPGLADSLAEGDEEVESFKVIVTDEHGASAEATVEVTVIGSNDAPVIGAASELAGDVTEPGDGVVGDLGDSGQLAASDVDNGAVLTWTGNATGDYGSLDVKDDGSWAYTLDPDLADSLAGGDSRVESFTVTVTDEHGASDTATLEVTVWGSNDAPEIGAASDLAGDVTEPGLDLDDVTPVGDLSDSGQLAASDVDSGAVLTWSAEDTDGTDDGVVHGAYGSLSVTEGGLWTYTLDADLADSLAEGDEEVESFKVIVTDEHGASAEATVEVTVIGSNDAPVIGDGADLTGEVTEPGVADGGNVPVAGVLEASGTVGAEDVDAGHDLTWSFTGGGLGFFDIDADTGDWTFTIDPADIDALSQGETAVNTYTVTVTDEFGASDTEDVLITLHGTNDVPTLEDAEKDVFEDDTVNGYVMGDDVDGDDTGATLTYALVAPVTGLVMNGDGSYSFDAEAYDYLSENQTVDVTAQFTATDSHGAVSEEGTLTLHLTGRNDPVTVTAGGDVTGEVTGDSDEDGNATDSGSFGFEDVDLNDVHTVNVSAQGEGYLGELTALVDQDSTGDGTGEVDWSFAVAQSTLLGLGANDQLVQTYEIRVQDQHLGDAVQVVTITVNGINDAVQLLPDGTVSGEVTEDGGTTETETAGGSFQFQDLDLNDIHSVSDITALGTGYLGSLTAEVVLDSTGGVTGEVSWSFSVANLDLQSLSSSDHLVQTYEIKVDDGEGGFAIQTVSVTIHGADEPVTVITVPGVSTSNSDSNDHDNDTLASAQSGSNGVADTLKGTVNGDIISGLSLGDTIYGGAGNDFLYGGTGTDSIFGGEGKDYIEGGNQNDQLFGGSGNDTILGIDGDDVITGGFGEDSLTGNGGVDKFVFIDLADTGDTISDFSQSDPDKIDLSAIDANGAAAGDQAFTWGATTATANGAWYAYDSANSRTVVYVDTNGSAGSAEMVIYLTGNLTLGSGDFIL